MSNPREFAFHPDAIAFAMEPAVLESKVSVELNAHVVLKSREALYNVGDVLRLRPEFGGMDAWVKVRSLRMVDGLFEASAIGARIESEAFEEVDGDLVANANFGLPGYVIEHAVRSIEGGG